MSDNEAAKPVEQTPAPAVEESKEPAAPDAAVSRPGAAIYTVLAFCMLTLFVVATPIEWIEQHNILVSIKITLFSTTFGNMKKFVSQYNCPQLEDRFRAVQAFAIITILLTAGALLAGINAIAKKTKLTIPLVLGVAVLVSSLITWTMGLRIFYQNFDCVGLASFAQQKLEIGPGLALFITGWTFSFLAVFVAFKEPTLPAVIPDELVDAVASYIYAAFAFVGFVFVVIGTPSKIVHFWLSETQTISATMWRITRKTYTAAGVIDERFDYNQYATVVGGTTPTSCPDIDKYAKFAQAFAIIAIAFYLIAVVVGALFVLKKIGKAVPIIVGIFGTLFALLSTAACAVLFYGRFCLTAAIPLSLDGIGFRLDAGVALFAAAVLLLAVATIILLLVAVVQHVSSGAKGGNVKPTAFLFLFGGVFSVFFLVLGASLTAFEKSGADDFNYDRWTLWKQYTLVNGALTITDFGCKQIQQRLVGAGGLIVISIILSAIAVIVGVAQLVNANMRKAASGVFLLSSLTQLVAWGLVVTVYTGSFCDNLFYTQGYKIGVGLGLTIASWCLTVTVSILNLIVGTD